MERFAINILHKRIYKICRLCGVDQPHKIPIIDGAETIIVGDEDEEASLAKKIEECVGIQVHKDDKMPQNICALCVDKINDFYEYRLMCAATNLQTRSILNLNLVEPSRKLLNFGEVSKVETSDDKKEDVKKVVEVPTSSSNSITPIALKKGKKKRGPPSPSPSPAPTTRIKAPVDVKDEPVPAIPVKALTKKERMKQLQLQKEKDEKKKKEDDKKDKKEDKLKKEKLEVKAPEPVNDQKHTRSKRKEPSPPKETPEKVELTVPPPKKIKFEHPCSYCSDEFKTQPELDGHLATKHIPVIRKFGCGSCRESFETVLESKDHNLWHQLTRTPYTCFKCKRKYDKNLALVKHMALNACGRVARGKPPTVLPDVQCRLCNKKFKTQNLYEWHGCFLKPKSNCPKCGKYFVKKQILTRHYMMFCTGTLPPPEPVIIPKAEPVDPAETSAAIPAATATPADRRKRRVAFAEPELPKEEREIPFPPPLEPEALASASTPTPSGSKKKSKKDSSTPTVTIKPVPPPPAAQAEKITSLLTTGAKLDRDSDIATINNLLSSVTEAIASISEAKAKKKKKKKDKNKDRAEAEAGSPAAVEHPKAVASEPKAPTPPPEVQEEKTEEEMEAYALAQEVGEMTLDQQLAFCSGKMPLVVLPKTTFKQEYTEIDTEPSQMQEPMDDAEPEQTVENGDGDEEPEDDDDNGYDDAADDNGYSGFQDDDDDEEEDNQEESPQTAEPQYPLPIKQEIEPEEPAIAPEEPATAPGVSTAPAESESEMQTPVVALKPTELAESLFDAQLAVNIKKEPGLEQEDLEQPMAKRRRQESPASSAPSPVSSLSSSRSGPQESSPKLILKIKKGLLNPTAETSRKPGRAIKTIVLDDEDNEGGQTQIQEEQRIPQPPKSTKKSKLYKKPDFLAVKIKQEKVDPAYERNDPSVVNQVELPGGIRIKQERLDPDDEPPQDQQEQEEEEEQISAPPQKKSRKQMAHASSPAVVVAFDGVRIKQEKPDLVQAPTPPPPAEDPKPQEKKKKSKGKINPFALLRQKLAAEAAAKSAVESPSAPQSPSPLPVITNVVGSADATPSTATTPSSEKSTTSGKSHSGADRRQVPVIAQVASIAKVATEPEFPVAIKQEPMDEESEEEPEEQQVEAEKETANEAEDEQQEEEEEAESSFPLPIKQEAPEEAASPSSEESPEEEESEQQEEKELPVPIKESESQQKEDASEEEEKSEEQEQEEAKKKESMATEVRQQQEEDEQEGEDEKDDSKESAEEDQKEDIEEEHEEESERHIAEKQEKDDEQTEDNQDDEDGDDAEEEIKEKDDVSATNEETNKDNEEEDEADGDEEEEDEEHVEKQEDVPKNEEQSSGNQNEEEQTEMKSISSVVEENEKSPAVEEEDVSNETDELEGKDANSLHDKSVAEHKVTIEQSSDAEIPRQSNELPTPSDQIPTQSTNEPMEESTSPISDIPMDDYDQNSQEPEPESSDAALRLPVQEPVPNDSNVNILESVAPPELPPEPSSTSEGCRDTRLESQLAELQNLLTEGLKPMPDSSQHALAEHSSLVPGVSTQDQSNMVQSASIGSSGDSNVGGIGGLEDDLDSLLNNKLEEMSAVRPIPAQDDLNLAIERELLQNIMPIGSAELNASSEQQATSSMLDVRPELLLEGTGSNFQQPSS